MRASLYARSVARLIVRVFVVFTFSLLTPSSLAARYPCGAWWLGEILKQRVGAKFSALAMEMTGGSSVDYRHSDPQLVALAGI